MGFYLNGTCYCAIAENLHQRLFRNKSGCTHIVNRDFRQSFSLGESLDGIQVDCLVFHAVDIVETELRHTALKRHLTALEADLALVARTRLRALVSTRRRAAVARTRAATYSLVLLVAAYSRQEIM